jgi:ABC-type sugar transport system permease subunit
MPSYRRGGHATLRSALRKPQFWLGLAVLTPTLVWYVLFQFGPVLESFFFSLVFVRLLHLFDSHYVGLSNYDQLFDPLLNPNVAPALAHTVIWTVLEYVYVLPLSLLLATCLVKITRGRTLFQIVLFLPVITPLVVVGLLMGHLFDPRVGLVNQALHMVGLPGLGWLHDPVMALPLAAGISAWRWLGLYTILLTAAMLNVPRDVGDAARVDGAGDWVLFRRITLPLLGHILVLVLILLLVTSVQEFTLPGLLDATSGYNPDPLVLMNQVLYSIGIYDLQLGVGSATAVLECVVTLVLSLTILAVFRPRWSY